MSRPRRPRTEEEVEAEVQSFGLTNESAAAIVRLGNTLKGSRKPPRDKAELLSPGRRVHSPSPLSQPVWKQAEIEDSSQSELEADIRRLSLDEADNEQTESSDSSSGEDESPRSQEPAASPRTRKRALSPIQEEEEEEEDGEKEGEGERKEESESEKEEEGDQNADSSENNAGR
ncbi:hypothetical protein ACHAPE_008427 [Trichoderma viride]